jgi:hypothetical protein
LLHAAMAIELFSDEASDETDGLWLTDELLDRVFG